MTRNHANQTAGQRLWRLLVHGLAWTICSGSTVACALAVHYLAQHMHAVRHTHTHTDTDTHARARTKSSLNVSAASCVCGSLDTGS